MLTRRKVLALAAAGLILPQDVRAQFPIAAGSIQPANGDALGYEQLVASNVRSPTSLMTPIASQIRLETRRLITFGAQPCTHVRLGYCGYRLGGTGAEIAAGAGYSLEASIAVVGAPNAAEVRVNFSGVTIGSVPDGAGLFVSDKISSSAFGYPNGIPAGASAYVKDSVLVSAASVPYVYTSGYTYGTGEGGCTSAATASQVMNGGPIVIPKGGASIAALSPLVAVIGAFTAPAVSLMFLGDSIARGRNDTLNSGVNASGGGIYVRGAWNVNGANLPWADYSVDGSTAAGHAGAFSRRLLMAPYITHAIIQPGTNDIQQGVAPATVMGNLQTLWQAFKSGGVNHVDAAHLISWVTSTSDSYATIAGQTLDPNFVAAGNAATLNSSIDANIGSNGLDGSIGWVGSLNDATQTSFWAVNNTANWMTTDGVHPSGTNGFTAGSAVLNARYATYVPAQP